MTTLPIGDGSARPVDWHANCFENLMESVADLLSASARRFGSKTFLRCPDRSLTFDETDRLAGLVAQNLLKLGVQPGDAITLWIENGWRWVVAYYGALRVGAVVNPVNVLLTRSEVEFIARDCRSRLVVASHGHAAGLRTALNVPVLDDRSDFEELLEPVATEMPLPDVGREDRAAICYTSGTTGHPKGAVLRHRAVLVNTLMTSLMHGRSAADSVVSALPCPHVYGNIVLNSAAGCGMTITLLPRFDPEVALEAIRECQATMFEGVPTMYLRMLDSPDFERLPPHSLRVCTVGGQTMPVPRMREAERRFGAPLLELWGMTELGGLGTTHPHNLPGPPGSIGVALPMHEARVVHMSDSSRPLPRKEVGELMIRGPVVMDGYFGNPAATGETIEADGWLHTGDLAYQDEDGYYFVVDRKKEVIITGGYNVYPAEVERVIAEHSAVAMVAVAAAEDEYKGQVPTAFVVLRSGTQCSEDDIITHCRASLASYKTPVAVQFMDDLPKTSTGKLMRRALATSRR